MRARALIWWTLAIIVILLVWSAFAEVDEVARGDGKVIPSRQLQVLQSVDGGSVSTILVREGDVVEKGQILLTIDPTRFESSVQENRAQYFALVAKAARLRAMSEGKPFAEPPRSSRKILPSSNTSARSTRRAVPSLRPTSASRASSLPSATRSWWNSRRAAIRQPRDWH